MTINLSEYEKIKDEYIYINNNIETQFKKLKKYFREDSKENVTNIILILTNILDLINSRKKLMKEHWKAIESVSSKLNKIQNETIKEIILKLNSKVGNLFLELDKINLIENLLSTIIRDLKNETIKTTKEEFKSILKKLREITPKELGISIKNKILIIENDFSLFININSKRLNVLFKKEIMDQELIIALSFIVGISGLIIGSTIFKNTNFEFFSIVVPVGIGALTYNYLNNRERRLITENHNKLVQILKDIS